MFQHMLLQILSYPLVVKRNFKQDYFLIAKVEYKLYSIILLIVAIIALCSVPTIFHAIAINSLFALDLYL